MPQRDAATSFLWLALLVEYLNNNLKKRSDGKEREWRGNNQHR